MKQRITAGICALLLFFPFQIPVRAAEPEREEQPLLPVVMYHHISRDSGKWNDYVVSTEEFRRDLAWLHANGWHSVGVRDLLAWYAGEAELPEKPFIITFDDGFESTLAYAEPLLAEYGFCGVVAVIGSVCEQFSQCGEHDPEISNLSWEDAAGLAQRGTIEVQCHTWDMHAAWPRCGCQNRRGESASDYRAALTEDLERFLEGARVHGVDLVPAIAYPFGAFTRETEKIASDEGFRIGFTCREQINVLDRDAGDMIRLGRYNRPHGADTGRFFGVWENAVTGSADG